VRGGITSCSSSGLDLYGCGSEANRRERSFSPADYADLGEMLLVSNAKRSLLSAHIHVLRRCLPILLFLALVLPASGIRSFAENADLPTQSDTSAAVLKGAEFTDPTLKLFEQTKQMTITMRLPGYLAAQGSTKPTRGNWSYWDSPYLFSKPSVFSNDARNIRFADGDVWVTVGNINEKLKDETKPSRGALRIPISPDEEHFVAVVFEQREREIFVRVIVDGKVHSKIFSNGYNLRGRAISTSDGNHAFASSGSTFFAATAYSLFSYDANYYGNSALFKPALYDVLQDPKIQEFIRQSSDSPTGDRWDEFWALLNTRLQGDPETAEAIYKLFWGQSDVVVDDDSVSSSTSLTSGYFKELQQSESLLSGKYVNFMQLWLNSDGTYSLSQTEYSDRGEIKKSAPVADTAKALNIKMYNRALTLEELGALRGEAITQNTKCFDQEERYPRNNWILTTVERVKSFANEGWKLAALIAVAAIVSLLCVFVPGVHYHVIKNQKTIMFSPGLLAGLVFGVMAVICYCASYWNLKQAFFDEIMWFLGGFHLWPKDFFFAADWVLWSGAILAVLVFIRSLVRCKSNGVSITQLIAGLPAGILLGLLITALIVFVVYSIALLVIVAVVLALIVIGLLFSGGGNFIVIFDRRK